MKHPSMYIQTVNKSTVWLSPDKMFLCPFYQSRNSFCGKGQGGLGKNKYPRKTCNLKRFDISVEKGTWSLESQGATVQMVLKGVDPIVCPNLFNFSGYYWI